MQEIILNYYPPVIKQVKEIQQIARAEDLEFEKLKNLTVEVIQNMFVFTADETGVARFEKILGITPKVSQSLDDRRLFIVSMLNRRKMSLSELMAMLSNYSEGIELINDFEEMEMVVAIKTDAGSIDALNKILDEILPLNIYFHFSLQRETIFRYKMQNCMFESYDPAASETEYCNFDNNKTETTQTGYVQGVTSFFSKNQFASTGQLICGLEYCLAMQTPHEIQEGVMNIETDIESTKTPYRICGDTRQMGEDPPYEMQQSINGIKQSQTEAANTPFLCGTEYAREEGKTC